MHDCQEASPQTRCILRHIVHLNCGQKNDNVSDNKHYK